MTLLFYFLFVAKSMLICKVKSSKTERQRLNKPCNQSFFVKFFAEIYKQKYIAFTKIARIATFNRNLLANSKQTMMTGREVKIPVNKKV